ncbi:hypothetical protein GCM10028799_79310 [Kribbella italica]
MNDVRPPSDTDQKMRVRVWFGDHPIADHVAEAPAAERYAAAMTRRFAGLRVTCVPVPDRPSSVGASR